MLISTKYSPSPVLDPETVGNVDTAYSEMDPVCDPTFFMAHLRQVECSLAQCSHSLVLISLDRFEVLCYSLGITGNRLVFQVIQRLLSIFKRNVLITSLYSGELALLLEDTSQDHSVDSIVRPIAHSLRLPFFLDGNEIYLTASLGIASTIGSLMEDAQLALLQAQSVGVNQYCFCDETLRHQLRNRLQLENDLRRGIQHQEFCLHYQPIVALNQGTVIGFEALVRWDHPQRGQISPQAFIPIAEDTGLIQPLGWWILETACQQLQRWQLQFSDRSDLTISVNLSSQQFAQPGLLDHIDSILAKTQLPGHCLKLEITETVLMERADSAIDLLYKLQDRGIQLCIDDFGTGYSSLSYLQQFPASSLKIDHSFTSRITTDRKTSGILQAVMMLAEHLNMDVVAEGIETEEQVWWLRAMGCLYGQGYWFSRPLDAQAAALFLASGFA